jgi:polar amino acid transport system substrate-binding protein
MTAVQIPNSTVVGQFPAVPGGEHYGLVLEKGSSLTPCVNKALAVLKADGTLTDLTKTWLSDKVSAPILQ